MVNRCRLPNTYRMHAVDAYIDALYMPQVAAAVNHRGGRKVTAVERKLDIRALDA